MRLPKIHTTNEDVAHDRTDFVEANPLKARNKQKLKNFLYSREGKMYTPIIPVRKKTALQVINSESGASVLLDSPQSFKHPIIKDTC